MMALNVPRRWTVMMLLSIHILPTPIFTYLVVLNITTTSGAIQIGLGTKTGSSFGNRFEDCVCNSKSTCTMKVQEVDTPDTLSESLTAENAVRYGQDKVYQCEYKSRNIECELIGTSICPVNTCTINMIIACSAPQTNVVVSWVSSQNPIVLSFSVVQVIDCCKTSTTTTEEITTSITLPSTTFTSANPTTDPITTTVTDGGSTTNVGIPQSTSPTPDNITLNTTLSGDSNQHMGSNDDSSQISGQNIGIIVGTAVAAIIITIIIMCLLWKFKTRREKICKTKTSDSAISVPRTVEETQVDQVKQPAENERDKASKTIAVVSPLVQSEDKESHVTQTAGDYTYIDIKSPVTSTSNTALTSQFPKLGNKHQNCTTVEADAGIQDTEYSHLGTNKDRLNNPYNCVDHQTCSTSIQPVIVPELSEDDQQLSNNLQSTESEHKSIDIVDVSYTRTEITPKTREKSNDDNNLKKDNNKTILTSSNSDYMMPKEFQFCQPTTVINVTKETVTDYKEMSNTIDEERQVYANAEYSMYEIPQEEKSSLPLDDSVYANV